MLMKAFVAMIALLLCGTSSSPAQVLLALEVKDHSEDRSRQEISTWYHLSRGLRSTLSVWDIGIGLTGVAGTLDSFYSTHSINFPPFEFDLRFTEVFSREGDGYTLGSRIGPDHVAWSIFSLQLSAILLLDEFSALAIDESSYAGVFYFGKALLSNMFLTELVKSAVYRVRPDGSDGRSFISGHASATFTYTSYIYREISDWIDALAPGYENNTRRRLTKLGAFLALYGWGAYVGLSRVYDRKHYLSDVVFGSAVGAFIGNATYSLYSSRDRARRVKEDSALYRLSIYPLLGFHIFL